MADVITTAPSQPLSRLRGIQPKRLGAGNPLAFAQSRVATTQHPWAAGQFQSCRVRQHPSGRPLAYFQNAKSRNGIAI